MTTEQQSLDAHAAFREVSADLGVWNAQCGRPSEWDGWLTRITGNDLALGSDLEARILDAVTAGEYVGLLAMAAAWRETVPVAYAVLVSDSPGGLMSAAVRSLHGFCSAGRREPCTGVCFSITPWSHESEALAEARRAYGQRFAPSVH